VNGKIRSSSAVTAIYFTCSLRSPSIEELTRLITGDPHNANLYQQRAELYSKRGILTGNKDDFLKSADDYNAVIRINPSDAGNYFMWGQVVMLTEEYKRAVNIFTTTIELFSSLPEGYMYRAKSYILMREYGKALQDYNKFIEIEPTVSAYSNRAALYLIMEQYPEALRDLDRAVSIDGEDDYAHYLRGEVYRVLERYQEAIIEFNRAIDINPHVPETYNSLGYVYYKLNKYEESINESTQAISLYPNSGFYENRARVYSDLAAQTQNAAEKAKYERLSKEDLAAAKLLGEKPLLPIVRLGTE
jgi:tetratricopeptide (TPR) repeat protein